MIYSFWLEGIYYLLNFIQKATTKSIFFFRFRYALICRQCSCHNGLYININY